MPINQVIRWQTSDSQEFNTEDEAVAHEANLMSAAELEKVLDPIWYRGIDMEDVILHVLRHFTFTRKED